MRSPAYRCVCERERNQYAQLVLLLLGEIGQRHAEEPGQN